MDVTSTRLQRPLINHAETTSPARLVPSVKFSLLVPFYTLIHCLRVCSEVEKQNVFIIKIVLGSYKKSKKS